MRLRVAISFTLILGSFWGPQKLAASPSTPMISQSEGVKNEKAILKYLQPILKSTGRQARIYYRTACQLDDSYPVPFPQINVQAPSKSSTGLTAVREIFKNDINVRVMEGRSGLISIRIGEVPDAILQTKISRLTLTPLAQYNYTFAFTAIEDSKEVRAAMLAGGVRVPPILINEITVQPAEGLPHLSYLMTNVTMDQVLDSIAKTFRGVVMYGGCTEPRLYRIHFAGGVYFDDSNLTK